MDKSYHKIVKHYESCFEKYGDTHKGVDWPNQKDAEKRYRVMLEINKFSPLPLGNFSLLDFGCGAGHLYEYILQKRIKGIEYYGLDISEKFVNVCRKKFPHLKFYCMDIMENHTDIPMVDYIIMNGVFTEKRELSFHEMWKYFCEVVGTVFNYARCGICFNVMSKAVDWERDDLFHLPTDMLIDFITKNLSRNFIIRNDYGLYEYTTYIYNKSIKL